MTQTPINIIFDGPPGPEAGRFVEVETDDGQGINVGEWIDRGDGIWALRIAEDRLSEPTEPVDTEPTWQAIAIDVSGFVLGDETLRAWCQATEEGKSGWAIPCEDPDAILIVTGSAKPVPQSDAPDEEFYRVPGGWTREDRFLEIDVSSDEPDTILRKWERAVAVAAAMNAAGVQG